MSNATTYEQLSNIMRDVFDDDDIVARADMTAEDVDSWDSLGNVRLFVALEQGLGVRFSSAEMSGLKNVGELAALIDKKRAGR